MLNLDHTILTTVVDQAIKDAADRQRWLKAIGRAVVELTTNPYLERQDDYLLIGSSSGNTYSANGTCSCEAYHNGRPCWHRAAARLVRLHDESQARQQAPQIVIVDRIASIISAQKAAALLNECFA